MANGKWRIENNKQLGPIARVAAIGRESGVATNFGTRSEPQAQARGYFHESCPFAQTPALALGVRIGLASI